MVIDPQANVGTFVPHSGVYRCDQLYTITRNGGRWNYRSQLLVQPSHSRVRTDIFDGLLALKLIFASLAPLVERTVATPLQIHVLRKAVVCNL
jgi:hypothetical protein